MRISGSGGCLRLGYQPAASLGSWTLTRTAVAPQPSYAFTATLADVDAFWSRQSPMTLDVPMGQRRWIWQDVQVAIEDQSLTATLNGGPLIH